MSPSIHVSFDEDDMDAAETQVAGWAELQEQGMVTEAEASEMIRQEIIDVVKIEARE